MEYLVYFLLFLLVFPVLVYVSVKLGTVAYYRGRHLFRESLKKEKSNGSIKQKTRRQA